MQDAVFEATRGGAVLGGAVAYAPLSSHFPMTDPISHRLWAGAIGDEPFWYAPLVTSERTPMSDRAIELAAALIRNFNEVPLERLLREPLYDSQVARLARGTVAQKLGASIDLLAPGKRSCPYHLHHAQEEMFVILEGGGTLRVAGEMLAVKAGDVIFIPPGPEYPHQIINTSDAALKYLSISTMEVPEICEYPDSGKYLAEGSLQSSKPFEVIDRRGQSRDYWDGEP